MLVVIGGVGATQGIGAGMLGEKATTSAESAPVYEPVPTAGIAPTEAPPPHAEGRQPGEPPVPAAGAPVTAPQVQKVRQEALAVSIEAGEDAPTMEIAGKTQTYAQGEELASAEPGESKIQGIDPRTGKPMAETSVYAVSLVGHFAISKHVPQGQKIPTGTQLKLLIDVANGVVVTTTLSNASRPLPEAISPEAAEAGKS